MFSLIPEIATSYERFIFPILDSGEIPDHMTIIMDGNHRYARKHGFSSVSVPMPIKLGLKSFDKGLNAYRSAALSKLQFDLSKSPESRRIYSSISNQPHGIEAELLTRKSMDRVIEHETADHQERLTLAAGFRLEQVKGFSSWKGLPLELVRIEATGGSLLSNDEAYSKALTLTVDALSLLNLTRDSEEVTGLMNLARDTLNKGLQESACFDRDNCAVRVIRFVDA